MAHAARNAVNVTLHDANIQVLSAATAIWNILDLPAASLIEAILNQLRY